MGTKDKDLTSPTPLNGAGSQNRGCMSAAEIELIQDIDRRIMIPIMCGATFVTSPVSLTKIGPTFRTAGGNTSAARARLRGKTFAHFLKHSAMLNSLVRKLMTEGRPASIKYRFCHAGFCKTTCINVAYCNVVKFFNDTVRKFVMKIKSGIFNSCMNTRRLFLFPGTLKNGKLALKLIKMPRIAYLFSSRECGEIFQAKVNSNTGFKLSTTRLLNLNDNIEKPIATPISGKISAVFDFSFWQRATIKNTESVSSKSKSIAFAFKFPAFKGNPCKGLFTSITKVWALMLLARFSVLLAHSVNCAGMKAKLFTATRGQHIKIKACRPPLTPLERVLLCVVSEIPDIVYRSCLLVKQAIKRFYAVAIDQDQFEKFSNAISNYAIEY